MYELNNKGVELSKQGRLEDAIDLFNLELEKNPKDPNVNFNMALVYIKKENFKEAIKYLEKSIEVAPCDDNLREMGVCYIRLKEFVKAKGYLVKAVTDYGSSDSNNVLGVLYFQLEHYEEARRYFEIATKLKPKNRDAWYNLSDTYKELGMNTEANAARHKYEKLIKNEI